MSPVGPDLSRLSISQLSELTGRDRRWIKRRLADAGVDPVARDGRAVVYPARASLAAIFGAKQVDATAERARLDRAKAELAELDLAQKRGELGSIAEMEEAGVNLLTAVRTRLLAIPSTTAEELAATQSPAEAVAIVERALYDALSAIANPEVVVKRRTSSRRR